MRKFNDYVKQNRKRQGNVRKTVSGKYKICKKDNGKHRVFGYAIIGNGEKEIESQLGYSVSVKDLELAIYEFIRNMPTNDMSNPVRIIDDIMVSALEGGITYWVDKVEPRCGIEFNFASDVISKGGSILIHDNEEDATYELTKVKLLQGIRVYLRLLDDSVYTERLKNSENYFLSCGALSALGIQLQSGAILFI